MTETFPFGKYEKHTPAFVALNDYSWLGWMCKQGIRKRLLKDEVERVRNALNRFTPVKNCYVCKKPATVFSIIGTDLDGAYIFCSDKKCHSSTGYDGGQQNILPIRYDTLLKVTEFDWVGKYQIKSFQKLLNECAGFEGNRTEDKCNQFIDDLVAKSMPKPTANPGGPRQLDLF